MIRLETLVYLEEVAKTLSITHAAENLYLSKSSLSAGIKNLEEELGVTLLIRDSYGVRLTPAGEMVVKKSKAMLEIHNQIKDECWIYNDRNKLLEVTCLMTKSFADNIFPGLLRSFQQLSGGARIVTLQVDIDTIIQKVQANKECIGFYVSSDDSWKNDFLSEKIVVSEISSYKLWAVTSKYSRYISDNIRDITLEELHKYPLIKYTSDSFVASDFRDNSTYVLSTDNMNVYNQAINDDIGIGIMSGLALEHNGMPRAMLRKINIKDAPKSKLYLLTNIELPSELRSKYEGILYRLEE